MTEVGRDSGVSAYLLTPTPRNIEAEWLGAQQWVAAAREALEEARARLNEVEERVRKARLRRKAAAESVAISEAAARRMGLLNTAPTRYCLQRLRHQEGQAAQIVRDLIASAGEVCDQFEHAWEALRGARARERESLEDLMRAKSLQEARSREEARWRRELGVEAERLENLRRREEADLERELTWLRDGHFDPRYDPYEIALRRSRRWV